MKTPKDKSKKDLQENNLLDESINTEQSDTTVASEKSTTDEKTTVINDTTEVAEAATTISNTAVTTEIALQPKKERLLSIDRIRGLCIFCFVCSVLMPLFETAFEKLAPLFEHAHRQTGLGGWQILPYVSIADLFAPMFIFIMGLTMVKSFKSREKKVGTPRAVLQLAVRFLGLIGLGIMLNTFEDLVVDLLKKEATFGELQFYEKVFVTAFWATVGFVSIMLILTLVSLILRYAKCAKANNIIVKINDVFANIFKYVLAIIGLLSLYILIVGTAEMLNTLVWHEEEGNPLGWQEYTLTKFGSIWWDTLQNIGLAGLMALPFVALGRRGRLTVASINLIVYAIMIKYGSTAYRAVVEGGLIGGIGWSSIVLFGTVCFDYKDEKEYWIIPAITLLAALFLDFTYGVIAFKRGCTPPYALLCISLSATVWGLFNKINDWKPKYDFLADWGSNPILNYAVAIFFIAILLGGKYEEQFAAMKLWPALGITVLFLGVFTAANWLMRKKQVYIKIS